MKKIPLILLSLFLLSFTGFSRAGSENTEDRKLSGFSSVKVSSGIDLFLSMGDAESVKVVADEDIIDNVKTEVENGTLNIYMKFKAFNWNRNKTNKVFVVLKSLESLDASSGSDVVGENVLKGTRIKVSASSGSDVKLKLEYDDIQIDSSSGSDTELTGTCNTLKASSSSGSDITAPDLISKKCHVSASSGADAVVFVSEELEADASSGGDVRYLGNPRLKNINESSGGDVSGK